MIELPDINEIVDEINRSIPQVVPPLLTGVMHCECVNPDGTVAWTEDVPVFLQRPEA